MKKLFSPILTAALITVMTTAAFAANDTAAPALSSGAKTGVLQANVEQKSKRSEFRSQIAPLKAEKKANREENSALRQQNKALLEQIKNKLSKLKSGETNLPDEKKEQLITLRADVKAIGAELKATEGQIKTVLEANRDSVKNMDLEAVQAAFDQLYGIQSNRHEKLVHINTKLAEMLALVG